MVRGLKRKSVAIWNVSFVKISKITHLTFNLPAFDTMWQQGHYGDDFSSNRHHKEAISQPKWSQDTIPLDQLIGWLMNVSFLTSAQAHQRLLPGPASRHSHCVTVKRLSQKPPRANISADLLTYRNHTDHLTFHCAHKLWSGSRGHRSTQIYIPRWGVKAENER